MTKRQKPRSVPRQWGADRRQHPSPTLPPTISDTRITVGRLIVVATMAGWIGYFATWLYVEFVAPHHASPRSRIEAFAYLIVVSLLTFSAVAYLVCRLGFLYRSRDHQRVPRAALDQFYGRSAPHLTVIVPSYREEERVVRATLLSAALQEYPDIRVVLLIDDPPKPGRRRDRQLLERARKLAGELQALLSEPHDRAARALAGFLARDPEARPTIADMVALAGCFEEALSWLNRLAEETEVVDHTDRFLVNHVILGAAADFAMTASALRSAVAEEVVLPRERLLELYRRLERVFSAELSSFERKQYASLSHEANKAMNLNSYIGLMGGSYRDVDTVSGRVLVPTTPEDADLVVPDPDYVLTLDADSTLLPGYCLRLVHLMEQSQHRRCGVAQTPYSAYPGAATRLERVAGASTDLQHIVHQGMTHYRATFWVGANAVLRKKALDEIRQTSHLGNWEIHRYIQDHTVIEDTESSIDLRTHGWQLYNYPERLSYSATPPDFGSLCIQRRRWANGGLLILPKLRRQRRVLRARDEPVSTGERFLRLNYMASICWSSVSLLLLLAYPFRNDLISPFLGLIALPYFMAMASDLRLCGYQRRDVLRIYGFNLVLLPINLAGVFDSVIQGISGDKSVFGRTPKVRNRTVPNFLFIVTPYLVVGLAAYTLVSDYYGRRWDNFVYAIINVVLASYAIVAFIGIRYSLIDIWVHIKSHLYKPVKNRPTPEPFPDEILAGQAAVDWASVLHFGGPGMTAISHRGALGAAGDPVVVSSSSLDRGSVPQAAFSWDGFAEFRTVFQPIFDLSSNRPVGYEALTRFDDGVPPDRRLVEVAEAGSGIEFELLLARAGVRAAEVVQPGSWVALNVSMALLEAGRALPRVLETSPREVVLEVKATELNDPKRSKEILAGLPAVSLSLTGVQPSYDCLARIRDVAPRFVKLERLWLIDLTHDKARQELISTLVAASVQGGFSVIAEGIETPDELNTLGQLGVSLGQGFLLGRPSRAPLADANLNQLLAP